MKSLIFLALVFFFIQGCDSSGGGQDVGGTYNATNFTVGITDVLAAGGSLEMTLRDGSVSGTFVIPDVLNEPGEPDAVDLSGSYVVTGRTVRFTQDADTFVRDAVWTFADDALSTTLGSVRIRLEKS